MSAQAPVIMLVDDDPDFQEMNKQVLETRGYRVVSFVDPQSALKQMEAVRPALIITDLMMEDLDSGFSFSRSIRETPCFAEVPIIVVTAISSRRGFDLRPHTPEELAAMCVDAYFDKPVAPAALLAKIEELLNARKGENRHE